MSENFNADPPNKEGATQCIARWTMETPEGWLGSYNKEAFEAYAEHVRKPLLEEIERKKVAIRVAHAANNEQREIISELRATIEHQREVMRTTIKFINDVHYGEWAGPGGRRNAVSDALQAELKEKP